MCSKITGNQVFLQYCQQYLFTSIKRKEKITRYFFILSVEINCPQFHKRFRINYGHIKA